MDCGLSRSAVSRLQAYSWDGKDTLSREWNHPVWFVCPAGVVQNFLTAKCQEPLIQGGTHLIPDFSL